MFLHHPYLKTNSFFELCGFTKLNPTPGFRHYPPPFPWQGLGRPFLESQGLFIMEILVGRGSSVVSSVEHNCHWHPTDRGETSSVNGLTRSKSFDDGHLTAMLANVSLRTFSVKRTSRGVLQKNGYISACVFSISPQYFSHWYSMFISSRSYLFFLNIIFKTGSP